VDDSSKPEYERPELDSTPKAPKQRRMQVVSFAEMHEDIDPDLSTKAFGEDVINSLELYDLELHMALSGMTKMKRRYLVRMMA